jgi:hypothetical protein
VDAILRLFKSHLLREKIKFADRNDRKNLLFVTHTWAEANLLIAAGEEEM